MPTDSPEHDSKQASYKEKAISDWDLDDLVGWINEKRKNLLEDDEIEKLRKTGVKVATFLSTAAHDWHFFTDICGLLPGTAVVLVDLSRELKEMVQNGKEQDTSTGNRQRAEDVEMTDAADMKSSSKVLLEEYFETGIKYRPPIPLALGSGANWKYQPHKDLYPKLATNILNHYYNYKNNRIDKSSIPSFYYLGGAGTGKSRHGTEFASSVKQAIERLSYQCLLAECCTSTHSSHVNYCEDICHAPLCAELSQRLENVFVFLVSFEGTTPLGAHEKSDPFNAIGVRMLHQLLGKNINDIHSKFVASPQAIFELVAKAEKVDFYNDFTGILVVDGAHQVSKSLYDGHNKDSDFYSLLVQIAALSLMARSLPEAEENKEHRRAPFIMTCVTASCFGPAEYALAKTGRYRVYLPLNRLAPPVWKWSQSKVFDTSPFTKLLVNDAGGHARAMEIMADLFGRSQRGLKPNFPEFADKLRDALMSRYRDAFVMLKDYTLPLVQCILSRRQIDLDDLVIPGSTLRWEDVTSSGLIWFTSDTRRGYLEAPYIWLWMICRSEESKNPGTSGDPETMHFRQFLIDWKFNDYEQISYLLTGVGEPPTWQSFERFCTSFRVLRSLGFGNRVVVPLTTLHYGCNLRDDRKTMVVNRHLKLAEAKHQYRTDSIEGPNRYSKAQPAKKVETEHNGILNADAQLSHAIINGNSAQAGDFFLSIQTPPASKIVREIGQCKFIQKKLSKKDYDDERKKSAGEDDIFIVYAPKGVSSDVELQDRCGIVDDSRWKEYFGPFTGRAYLSLESSSSKKRKTQS